MGNMRVKGTLGKANDKSKDRIWKVGEWTVLLNQSAGFTGRKGKRRIRKTGLGSGHGKPRACAERSQLTEEQWKDFEQGRAMWREEGHSGPGRNSSPAWGLGAQQLWRTGLSCTAACGIFPVQGLNPCPLHWQGGLLTAGPPGKPSCLQFSFS